MPRGSLEIGLYEPPAPADSARLESTSHPSAGSRTLLTTGRTPLRYTVPAIGAVTSLLLHALLITSITWGGIHARAHSRRPPDLSGLGTRAEQDSELTMELEPLEDINSSTTRDETAIMSDSDEVEPVNAAEDAATRSALVGRYLGQIDARIERAWRKPRIPLDEGLFSCRVRIEQGPHGDVREIMLEHCNGDARWQVSLVHAIQTASPLPAPPDPKVFTPVIRMNFRSEPYSARAAQDAYESARQNR